MRHLWSFLAGLISAPIAWVLITLGQDESNRIVARWVAVGRFNTANLIEPTVYLAVAGIVLGLLGTLRFSPLGPLVAGLVLVGPYVGLFIDPFTIRDWLPDSWSIFGDQLPLFQPVQNGTLFLIGALLLMATFSVQRWRRWAAPVAAAEQPASTSESDEERTPTDWSVLTADLPDHDVAPPTLHYPPAPTPPTPLPRRDESPHREESPWSAPPRSAAKPDTSATTE